MRMRKEKIGKWEVTIIEPGDPPPEEPVTLVVIRVADATVEPWPALAARRVIVTCHRCHEPVWLDPLSLIVDNPEIVCLQCLGITLPPE